MTKLPARPLAKLEKACAEARSSDELLGGVGALLAREADADAYAPARSTSRRRGSCGNRRPA